MKVLWKSNEFLQKELGKLLRFDGGWVMGAWIEGNREIWLNPTIMQLKHPIYKYISTLLHEFVHSFNINLLDKLIDGLSYWEMRSDVLNRKRRNP